jgi:hypothetical protein
MVQACRCVGLLLVLQFNAITCHDSSAEKLAQDLPLLAVDDRARGEGDFMKLELLRKKLGREGKKMQTKKTRKKEMLGAEQIGSLTGEIQELEHPKKYDATKRETAAARATKAVAVKEAHVRRQAESKFITSLEVMAEDVLIFIAVAVGILAGMTAIKMISQNTPIATVMDDIALDSMYEDEEGHSIKGSPKYKTYSDPLAEDHAGDDDSDYWKQREVEREEERRGGPRRRSAASASITDLEDV